MRTQEPPGVVHSPSGQSWASWISLESALDEATLASLPQDQAYALQKTINLLRQGYCVQTSEIAPKRADSNLEPGIENAITRAATIVQAKVVARTPGFQFTSPGTLYQIQILDSIKGSLLPASLHNIFLPHADFTAEGISFCAKSDALPKYNPALGDKLLLLLALQHQKDDSLLPLDPAYGFFPADITNRVHLPPFHSRTTILAEANDDIDALTDIIKRRLDITEDSQ